MTCLHTPCNKFLLFLKKIISLMNQVIAGINTQKSSMTKMPRARIRYLRSIMSIGLTQFHIGHDESTSALQDDRVSEGQIFYKGLQMGL